MEKKKWISYLVGIAVLLSIGIIIKLYHDDSNYYEDVYDLNRNLEADGIKLMMTIEEVHNVYGKEEVHNVYGKEEVFNHGFGGDLFKYPSKGVCFSVSTDSDYDLYNKVGGLRISNDEYSLFGIFIGEIESKATEILLARGYKENNGDYGKKSYGKGCVYIDFSVIEDVISDIRIIIKDKNFDPDRIY